jgi:hypothetical protein
MDARFKRAGSMRYFLLIIIALLFTLSFAFAGGKPTPIPAPKLELSPGLNAVIGLGDGLELFKQIDDAASFSESSWALGGSSAQLADIDADGFSEIIVVRACNAGTKQVPLYCHYLDVYKQGVAGIWSTTKTTDKSLTIIEKSASAKLLAANVDDDPASEIIMMTTNHLGVYDYDETTGWTLKIAELPQSKLGQTCYWKDMAFGNVLDDVGDSYAQKQLVIAGHYMVGKAAPFYPHPYLLVVSLPTNETTDKITTFNLNPIYLDPVGQGLKAIPEWEDARDVPVIEHLFVNSVKIGCYLGGSKNEIWISGTATHKLDSGIYERNQGVYAWTVDETTGEMTSIPTGFIYANQQEWGTNAINAKINFLPADARDILIIGEENLDGNDSVNVYDSNQSANPIFACPYTDRYVNKMELGIDKDGCAYMFVGGQIAGSVQGRLWHFLQIFKVTAEQLVPIDDPFEGPELFGNMAVGLGTLPTPTPTPN